MNMTAVRLGAAIAVSALMLAGCSGGAQAGGDRGGMAMDDSTAEASATGHDTTDVIFSQQMIAHHQQGQEMARLASSHASDARVKDLASKIDQAQDPQLTAMRGWLGQWGMPTSAGPMPDMPDMPDMSMAMMSASEMQQLQQANGNAFDKLFVRMMTAHHESGVGMAQAEAATGANAQAKELAQSIINDETAEIATMRKLQATL